MIILILFLVIIQTVISSYVFHFQRYTLNIGRLYNPNDVTGVQILLTPNWMGLLGWINKGLIILTILLFIINALWIYLVGYLLLVFLGLAVIDMINPFPTKIQAFKLMKKTLSDDKNKAPLSMERIRLENRIDDYINEI